MTQPAVCEINKCGILAVGRCTQCSKAFCKSHWDYNPLFVFPPDIICYYCRAKAEKIKLHRQKLEQQKKVRLIKHIKTIVDVLARADGAGLLKRRVHKETKKNFFGKYTEIYEDIEPAWPIGVFIWEMDYYKESRNCYEDTGITKNYEIVLMGNAPELNPSEKAGEFASIGNSIDITRDKSIFNRKRELEAGEILDNLNCDELEAAISKLENIAKEQGVKLK